MQIILQNLFDKFQSVHNSSGIYRINIKCLLWRECNKKSVHLFYRMSIIVITNG